MRASRNEQAACAVFAGDQRAQRQARRRLHSLAQGNPEKVKEFLANQPIAKVRNNPAMMSLSRIVGA